LPVHTYGLPVDIDPLVSSTSNHNVLIIEDSAEALGVEYKGKKAGSLGDAATFSFYANKIVTGGEGGMISTNDSNLALKLRNMRTLNFRNNARFISDELGWNSRIHGLSAALIYSQFNRLDSIVKLKQEIAGRYLAGLAGHPWFTFQANQTSYSENTYWVFGVFLNSDAPYNAGELQIILRELGIDSRRFFCPMHLQPVLRDYQFSTTSGMKISESLWLRGLYIPCGLGMTQDEQDRVIEVLNTLPKNHKRSLAST
jgi:perosamine synthetase